MTITAQIAKLLRDVHYGGNWTGVNLKDALAGLSWEQAVARYTSFNSIAALVYHINYYTCAVTSVLEGQTLNASDRFSFDLSPIESSEDWEKLINKTWADADKLAGLIEQLPEAKLAEMFSGEKYGTYYRNVHGLIEHCHYHLGQIVLLRKILTTKA